MAMAESDEAATHLRQINFLTVYLRKIRPETCDALIEKYKIISKELNNLIKHPTKNKLC